MICVICLTSGLPLASLALGLTLIGFLSRELVIAVVRKRGEGEGGEGKYYLYTLKFLTSYLCANCFLHKGFGFSSFIRNVCYYWGICNRKRLHRLAVLQMSDFLLLAPRSEPTAVPILPEYWSEFLYAQRTQLAVRIAATALLAYDIRLSIIPLSFWYLFSSFIYILVTSSFFSFWRSWPTQSTCFFGLANKKSLLWIRRLVKFQFLVLTPSLRSPSLAL